MINKVNKKQGFTLIELLVVMAILGVLASILLSAISQARINARNSYRKISLRQVQKALELYRIDYGVYPIGSCRINFCYETGDPENYIPGLAPIYIPTLPHDPKTGVAMGGCDEASTGYKYKSNGRDYKVIAYCLAEGSEVSSSDYFYDNGRPTSYTVYTSGGKNW